MSRTFVAVVHYAGDPKDIGAVFRVEDGALEVVWPVGPEGAKSGPVTGDPARGFVDEYGVTLPVVSTDPEKARAAGLDVLVVGV